jgi:DGQHR domain-containing protein
MICYCCGFEIKDKSHQIENGAKYVCDKCWNNSDLFFPEKIQGDERLELLSKMATSTKSHEDSINLKVFKLVQKDIEMYVGKMQVKDILELYELDKFKEEELEGYQREQYEERTSELVEYLTKCPLAIMPAILVSLRKTRFKSNDGDYGILKIPRQKGSIWIIDGQHRVGGFSKIREKFVFSKDLTVSLFSNLMDYEFPVVFVDSDTATQKIRASLEQRNNDFSPEDIERTIFFIVNKTQRGISPSLKDALLYRIKTSGIEGLPIIRKENWRALGAEIGINLNSEDESPLKDKINISGKREMGKPLQLNSFVSSLEKLLLDKEFAKLNDDDKTKFIKAYWTALKDLVPQAFEREKDKDYMLLKALGIHCIHWLARDIFRVCLKEASDFKETEVLKNKLVPLKSFDWYTKTSPLSGLGGLKGASAAYDMLVDALCIGQDVHGGKQTLQNFITSSGKS